MNRKVLFVCLLFTLVSLGFTFTVGSSIHYIWPKKLYEVELNALSKKKIALGRLLFYDTRLSANNTISCASCHSPFNAFAHADHALSHGIYDSIGKRNAPSLMNLAWQPNFMWDGAIHHIDFQALAPLTHPGEMGESLENVLKKLNGIQKYRTLFFEAWNDSNANSSSLLKSLSQFMLSLESKQSKYDSVARKEAVFTPQEERGYNLFKKHCNSCHQEPLFTNYSFQTNGLRPNKNINDIGRYTITHQVADSFKFKVPTLRNIEYSFPYMHDGRYTNLTEVLQFYAKHATVAKNGAAVPLSAEQKIDLQVFLLTLSDPHFIFNPAHGYPMELLTIEK